MSNMDADAILKQLAVIEREIPGVRRAYDNPPNSISMADMPMFINLPGPMNENWIDGGEDEDATEALETREYECILIVSSTGTGVSGEAIGKVPPLLAAVRNKFASYPFLKGFPIRGAQLQRDSGVRSDILFGGVAYFGVRFIVVVETRIRVPYAE